MITICFDKTAFEEAIRESISGLEKLAMVVEAIPDEPEPPRERCDFCDGTGATRLKEPIVGEEYTKYWEDCSVCDGSGVRSLGRNKTAPQRLDI